VELVAHKHTMDVRLNQVCSISVIQCYINVVQCSIETFGVLFPQNITILIEGWEEAEQERGCEDFQT
jgi:hypothetical protein